MLYIKFEQNVEQVNGNYWKFNNTSNIQWNTGKVERNRHWYIRPTYFRLCLTWKSNSIYEGNSNSRELSLEVSEMTMPRLLRYNMIHQNNSQVIEDLPICFWILPNALKTLHSGEETLRIIGKVQRTAKLTE